LVSSGLEITVQERVNFTVGLTGIFEYQHFDEGEQSRVLLREGGPVDHN
jgi:hypothetical protein